MQSSPLCVCEWLIDEPPPLVLLADDSPSPSLNPSLRLLLLLWGRA